MKKISSMFTEIKSESTWKFMAYTFQIYISILIDIRQVTNVFVQWLT